MYNYYRSHFKEELIATAILMGVVVTGSFLLAWRSLRGENQLAKAQQDQPAAVLGTTQEARELEEVINQLVATPKPVQPVVEERRAVQPIAQPTPTASPSAIVQAPSYANTIIEQPYGTGGEYDTADYRLTLLNPRLVVSANRTFKVDVVLANKRIEAGLKNRLSATIIKDGTVIAESVPFSLSESAVAFPGEQISFTATMSLISGTDISRLKFMPMVETVADVLHDL